ncbi:MAG: hypothetical protein NTU88_03470 [Armatimonadetes bacterium]|nr:hypothetical protein [Armatimonadota bacterium]
MVRTQLQIDDATYEALRDTAHKQRKSMSAVAREILQEHLEGTAPRRMKRAKFTFVGAGASGRKDISVRHDEALAEDFR